MTPQRYPQYPGKNRKLVLAFDIGTTYSGISYSILDPGQVPEIKGVMRFPAHEQISGASKIPTVLYYDKAGQMTAAGAEAVREGIFEMATDEGWFKTEWFKLHVQWQRGGRNEELKEMLPPLPPHKTIVSILADFMLYLYTCARTYIQDTHASGSALWQSLVGEIDYVITHPNGWEGYQRTQIHDAAVLAGLVAPPPLPGSDPDLVSSSSSPNGTANKGKVTFLTEGEASLHYAIQNGLPSGALEKGEGIIIVDAGGGTIDLSAYRVVDGDHRNWFEEIGVPHCHFLGSTFVSLNAKVFLSKLLAESSFIDDLDHIVQRFDTTTKLRFRSERDPQFVRFGGNRDTDEEVGIRYGQLKLSGEDVASFFKPSIDCIINAVLTQRKTAHNPISHVILVGGFASSDWLYSQVESSLSQNNLTIIRPENHVSKAVSDGAISFYLHRQVRSRISKHAYGAIYRATFDEHDPDHARHAARTYVGTAGFLKLSGVFRVIVPQNVKVEEGKEYRWRRTRYNFVDRGHLTSVRADIWCYRGTNPHPKWKDDEPEMYSRLCRIFMDLSQVPYQTRLRADNGAAYYEILYDYILFYEGTEMKAQTAWTENGVEKRSRAYVVYDPVE